MNVCVHFSISCASFKTLLKIFLDKFCRCYYSDEPSGLTVDSKMVIDPFE